MTDADVQALPVGEFSALVAGIYDTVFDPFGWSLILRQVCGLLRAHAASIHIYDPTESRALLQFDHGSDPHYMDLANTRYAAMSPVGGAVLFAEIDKAIGLYDLISEEELVETRFYREWCVPQRYHDMMGVILARGATHVGALSAVRLVDQPRFGHHERQILELLAPHARRAVEMARVFAALTAERDRLDVLVERLSYPVIIVDRDGRVLSANAAAKDYAGRSATLSLQNDFVRFHSAASAASLRSALASNRREPHFGLLDPEHPRSDSFSIVPLTPELGQFAVFIRAAEIPVASAGAALKELFGLTPRELSVLLPLLEGRDPEQVAEYLGIGLVTVRSHLAQLFRKTGTTRQADLVQRVLKAIPAVA